MRYAKLLCVSFVAVLLSACASNYFSAHNKDYVKKSRQIPAVVVPKGVPAIKQKAYYPVPVVSSYHGKADDVSLVSPPLRKK